MNIKEILKNNFFKFHFEFRKFFASKILGKKYIKVGKCKACGKCCQGISVKHGNKMITDEEEFKRLQKQHFFYSYLKVVENSEFGLIFECTKLDKEKGICTAYSKRALICREYPKEEIFMMGGIIGDECGFSFVPIESFESVFNKIQKKQSNKDFKFIFEEKL